MRLQEWETIIQKIVDEYNHEQKRPDQVWMKWRVKLEKEPAFLKPYQIDEIMREVRQRLSTVSQ